MTVDRPGVVEDDVRDVAPQDPQDPQDTQDTQDDRRDDGWTAAGSRRRHPSAQPWRTDHHGLAARLAAHLEAQGWSAPAARASAEAARRAAVQR